MPPDLLDRMHERTLPGFMRNNALPIFTSDGGLWVFLQSEAVLERFDPSGSPVSRTTLHIPEMERIREAFFDWYADVEASDLVRFFGYAEDATVEGDSIWLLWNSPRDGPALVTVHGGDGDIGARVVLRGSASVRPDWEDGPPRRRFAVDGGRARLYLLDQHALTLTAFQLPPELFGD